MIFNISPPKHSPYETFNQNYYCTVFIHHVFFIFLFVRFTLHLFFFVCLYWTFWVTLVNKTIQVSSVQLSNTSPVYYIVCAYHTSWVSFHHHFPSFSLLHPIIPWVSTMLLFVSVPFPLIPSSFFLNPFPLQQVSVCIYESVSILFFSLFCSLDSTY